MVRVDPLCSVRLLLQSSVGVITGILFAMLLASLLWPVGGHIDVVQDGLLAWISPNVLYKPREKGFYLLALFLGTVGAYLATSRFYLTKLSRWCFGLILFLPIINYFATQTLQNNTSFFLLTGLVALLGIFLLGLRQGAQIEIVPVAMPSSTFSWKKYSVVLLVMALLLLPTSFEQVAVHISMKLEREMHVVSFMIGPALYFFGNHLLPGTDYFTQYSLGMGWFFSHFLGQSSAQAMVHYIYFVIITTWLFCAQLLFLLSWLYRSWLPATIVTLLFLILLFHTQDHFFDPSSSVLRYPLMGICAWLFARWNNSQSMLNTLSLALGLALSVFFNTETGIIFSVAVSIAYLLINRRFLPLLYLGFTAVLFLFAITLSIFGNQILSSDFAYHLIHPMLIYGKMGFGGKFISWSIMDLNWFYNLIAPGVGLATLALITHRVNNSNLDKERLAVLVFFIVSGLLMLVKYVNMAIVGVWQMNALGLLVALGWWGKIISERFNHKSGFITVLVLALAWLGIFSTDSRNPSLYGFRAWLSYPSWITTPFRSPPTCTSYACVPDRPSEKDIALIKTYSKPGEQIAMIDFFDWTYLLASQRPPLMLFLPSSVTFTKQQLEGSLHKLQQSPYLFLPKGLKGEPIINQPDFKTALMPTFYEHYVKENEGDKLTVWRRKA